ncbi:chalcone isomerase family protein [Haliangium sp.]|uniref:chalcone isomerase family protein n=1 Tax=Haliangium sp. TaxID=2663208 RepID=UPI003D102CF1
MKFTRWLVPALSLALTAALATALSTSAQAGKKAGVTMPDKVKVGDKTLVLNSMGLREVAFFDVYVAGLYVEKKSKDARTILDAGQAKRIHLQLKRDVSRDDMVEALEKAFDKNAGAKKQALAGHMKTFKTWLAKLDEGETMTFTYVPDEGLTVAINGKKKGTIANADFAWVIFSGWLGPKATDDDLRDELLGR